MKPLYIVVIICGVLLVSAALCVFLYLSNNLLGVTRYTVKNPKVRAEGVRIVLLSDLHGKSFGKDNRRLIKRTAEQNPDIVAITGDIIHKYRERDIEVAVALVRKLCEIAPVYYVSGNHEMRSVRYRELKERLISAGARVLDDVSEEVCGLNLCGVNCASIKKGEYFKLSKTDMCNVLLAHYPHYIARYAAAGYDLALCGHAHGGQWRIPFTRVGFFSPGQGLFPKYTCGAHMCADTCEIISRGLGNSECPIRLFNRPEAVLVVLEKG